MKDFFFNSDNPFHGMGRVCVGVLFLVISCSVVAVADGPAVSAGVEIGITAPKTGKTFLLYVPVDYTHKRKFPVIFCYHGYGGAATTWPFKQVTRGEGFIVVGMNYATDRYYKNHLPPAETGPEKVFFDEVLSLIASRVNIAEDYIFMGGYSQGGYSTTVLGEQLLDRLAGRLVLGAGRRDVDMNPPSAKQIRGHPVFYGVGALDDPHCPRAERAVALYTEWGADVTFERWEGETHRLSPEWLTKTKMREWLLAYGPMKQVESGVEKAQRAEEQGKLGEAFTFYTQIAGILPDMETCRAAEASATRIETEAETQFNRLKETTDATAYVKQVKRLEVFRDKYMGSVFAEQATELLTELLNAKADALEARAQAAAKAENYARALQLYKLYLTHFREAKRYAAVQKRVNVLKNNLKTQ